jgi:tetratricopeptide (TPR) repeat protein
MNEALNPKQLEVEARAAYQAGDFIKAAQVFQAAEGGYDIGGNELMAAEMANNRSVALLQAGEAEAALQALVGKKEAFVQEGDLSGQAITLGNQAAALEALKRLDEASEAYTSSAELFRQSGEDEFFTATMQSLSALQLRTGKPLDALVSMQAGINRVNQPGIKQRLLKRILNLPFKLLNR